MKRKEHMRVIGNEGRGRKRMTRMASIHHQMWLENKYEREEKMHSALTLQQIDSCTQASVVRSLHMTSLHSQTHLFSLKQLSSNIGTQAR